MEKTVPSNLELAIWQAVLQIDPDTLFIAGGRLEHPSVKVISNFAVYHPLSNTCEV